MGLGCSRARDSDGNERSGGMRSRTQCCRCRRRGIDWQIVANQNDVPHILPSLPRIAVKPPPRQSLPFEPVCAIFRRYLHGQKLKFTPERAMMLDAVLRKTGLFEAESLVQDLKQLGHRVSRATVYRTLAHLQDAGVCKQVFFDNKQSYYEVIAGRQAYDYLIDVESGRVIEFSSEKLKKLRDEICREHGMQPLSHQFHIFAVSDGSGSRSEPAMSPKTAASKER
jgi:Fur family ferric uptake transcriptional regulator